MNHRVLLYGAPYSGKTTFASQWPKPFAITFDNNAQYILKDGKPMFPAGGDNSYYVKDLEDYMAALATAEKGGFETLIIDPLDLMGNMVRDKVLDDEGITDEAEGQFGRPWRLIKKLFEKLLTRASQFDGNIIFVSWENEKDINDRLGRPVTHYEPSFNRKLITHVTGLTSEVIRAKQVVANGKTQFAISLGQEAPIEMGNSRIPIKSKLVPNDIEKYMNNFDI